MEFKIGVVGLTQRAFIEAFSGMPDARVTALCDIDEDRLNQTADEFGVEARFTDFSALAQTDVDVVVLCTPIQVHGPHAIEAMKCGKHVLCQYIAASTPEEAEELAGVARASGARYMYIETDCYERRNMIMRALADKGVLGDLTLGAGYYLHDCKSMGRKPDGAVTWRGELWRQGLGGSVAAVHTCQPLLEVFGERVDEVYAYGPGPRTISGFTWGDYIYTACRFPSGRVITLNTSVFCWRPVVCGYCLQGTRGLFEFDKVCVADEGKLSDWQPLDRIEDEYGLSDLIADAGGHGSSWHAIAEAFMTSLRTGAPPPQGLGDALHITAIGWAADESLASGQPVKVQRFED